MTTKTLSMDRTQPAEKTEAKSAGWAGIYRVGAAMALLIMLVCLLDILITLVPGTGFVPGERTAVDWFAAFQRQPLLSLRDMGMLNVVTTLCTIFIFFALVGAHRRVNPAGAALALMILCIGSSVYIANNMALPMLSLSGQYAAADSESQKAMLVSAGQVLLAQEDVGAGSFTGSIIPELAGVLMALVMLRGGVFTRWAGWAGLLGQTCLMAFNILAAFVPGQFNLAMSIAMLGGPLLIVWYILTGIRLIRVAKESD